MDAQRFKAITAQYARLRIAILGDFCLDRYLEIDPSKQEISIETGLPVHNVVRVRSQPGGAGTVLNNLCALGVGTVFPIGFVGEDGEGFELRQALERHPQVRLDYFIRTSERHTFSYCKPLLKTPDGPPRELNRLDIKNWSATPAALQDKLIAHLREAAGMVDAVIGLDQVDVAETGVVTKKLVEVLGRLAPNRSELVVLADSRRGLSGFPPVVFKMNAAELAAISKVAPDGSIEVLGAAAADLARRNKQLVFVTLAERGLIAASPSGAMEHLPALPVRGPIDIVGAGDAVTANLVAALAAGASPFESLEMARAAASIVIHKLGTTGTANIAEIEAVLR